MKKLMIGMLAVGFVVGLAFSAYSAEVKEKTTVKTKGDTTIEKTEVKGENVKAKQEVKTTPEATMTKEEVKGKNVKMKSKEIDTAEGSAGKTKVKVKNGALKDLSVEWVYYRQGPDYVLEYNVKDKGDPELKTELNLTDEQYAMLKPGMHTWTATRDIGPEVRDDFRQIIISDLVNSVKK